MKTSNNDARKEVEALKPFTGNNTFAELKDGIYIVYSYGYHYPLYVYNVKAELWIKNISKWSATTTKHASQLCPYNHPTYKHAKEMSTKEIQDYLDSVTIYRGKSVKEIKANKA